MPARLFLRLLLCLAALLAPAARACPPQPPPPTEAALAAAARSDRGLLWRIQKDGRTSWLYGTLHVGRAEWMQPGPRVAAALAQADVVALELDPEDPAAGEALAREGDPAPALPPALAARLARQVARSCIDAAIFRPLHPAMQALLLSVFEARWAGLDAAWSQENALAQAARSNGRRVLPLETAALQRDLLVPTSRREVAAMVDGTLRQLENGSARRVITRLADAWQKGDLDTLAGYERWCDCARTADERAAMRLLNDGRNPALADGIDALHGQGMAVFAAVGALHMTGPQSLPRLLAARGFTVERIVFGAQ